MSKIIPNAKGALDQLIASEEEVKLYNKLISFFPEIKDRAIFCTSNNIGIMFKPQKPNTRWLSLDGIYFEYYYRYIECCDQIQYNDAVEEYVK